METVTERKREGEGSVQVVSGSGWSLGRDGLLG